MLLAVEGDVAPEESLKEEFWPLDVGRQPVQPERLVRAEVHRLESKEQVRDMGSGPICLKNRKLEEKVWKNRAKQLKS